MIKKTILFIIVFGSAAFSSNLVRADQFQPFRDCSKIAENDSRLACFDSAAKKISSAVTDQNNNRKVELTRENQVENFGKSQLTSSPVKAVREKVQQEEKEKKLDNIKLKVVKYTYTKSKKFVAFMENGQVWKQNEGRKIHLPKGEFDVTIKKGLIGGYIMNIPGKKSFIRVKRLK